jgi:hypothetical protein
LIALSLPLYPPAYDRAPSSDCLLFRSSAPVLNTTIAVATIAAGGFRVISAGVLALGLIHAAPALLSLPSVDLPLSFRSSHLSVGAHLSGVVVPNASPVVQPCLPGLCHLSPRLGPRFPPSGCLHFHIRECQCSMLASPLVLARRQLPHQLPAAADLSLSGRSCSVYTRCACAVDPAFSGSSVASRLFSLLVCARLCLRMSPCRMHHLPSGFD